MESSSRSVGAHAHRRRAASAHSLDRLLDNVNGCAAGPQADCLVSQPSRLSSLNVAIDAAGSPSSHSHDQAPPVASTANNWQGQLPCFSLQLVLPSCLGQCDSPASPPSTSEEPSGAPGAIRLRGARKGSQSGSPGSGSTSNPEWRAFKYGREKVRRSEMNERFQQLAVALHVTLEKGIVLQQAISTIQKLQQQNESLEDDLKQMKAQNAVLHSLLRSMTGLPTCGSALPCSYNYGLL
eukprot:tig00020951_g16442.t1